MTSKTPVSRRSFLSATAAVGGCVLANSAPGLQGVSATAAPATPAADRWQIGCYTRFWNKYYYLLAMDAVAEVGFKYVGLMTHTGGKTGTVLSAKSTVDEAAKAGEEATKRGLSIPSIYFGGINTDKRDLAAAEMRHLIDLAAAAGAASVLQAGPGSDEESAIENYYGGIADSCDYAQSKNIALTLKPHAPQPINSAQLRAAVEKVGHKNFTVYYDPGNVFIYSQGKVNPLNDVAGVDGLVTGLVIKDYRSQAGSEGTVSLTPGTGEVDFPALFAKLKQGGFTSGPLLIEPPIPGDWSQIVAEAKKTRRFLEELVR